MDANTLERVTDAAKSCLLPTLTIKIGDQLIAAENFVEFKLVLQDNLRLLLDLFHAYEHELLDKDLNTLEFRKYFSLVLCEQGDNGTLFQTNNETIKDTVLKLKEMHVKKLVENDRNLLKNIFDYFHSLLGKETWKYNFGAVHSFLIFIECCFGTEHNPLQLDYDQLQFILATGLNLMDHFEPDVQIIGLKLFNVLLHEKHRSKVVQHNIDLVVLADTKNSINKSKEYEFCECLLTCLHKCITIQIEQRKISPSHWSDFDDIFEALLQRLALENDKELSMLYLNFIIKFSTVETKEQNEFSKYLNISHLKEEVLKELQFYNDPSCCKGSDPEKAWHLFDLFHTTRSKEVTENLLIFRWIKKILILLQNEAFKLGGSEEITATYLNQLHMCYLCTVFTVPVVLLNNFHNFIEKFTMTLCEVAQVYKANNFITQGVFEFLQTIKKHLSGVQLQELEHSKLFPALTKLSFKSKEQEAEAVLLEESYENIVKLTDNWHNLVIER